METRDRELGTRDIELGTRDIELGTRDIELGSLGRIENSRHSDWNLKN